MEAACAASTRKQAMRAMEVWALTRSTAAEVKVAGSGGGWSAEALGEGGRESEALGVGGEEAAALGEGGGESEGGGGGGGRSWRSWARRTAASRPERRRPY